MKLDCNTTHLKVVGNQVLETKTTFNVETEATIRPEKLNKTELVGAKALNLFAKATAFGAEFWVKASWDLEIGHPKWWEQKKDGTPVNYLFRLNTATDTLTVMKWGGKDADGDTQWVADRTQNNGFARLRKLSDAGATIYFYPNKPDGGICNKHVARTDLLFYEIDDKSLDEQKQALENLKRLGIKPAGVVFTGGKSLHVYVRLNEAVDPITWLNLNRKLCVVQDGDPAVCNPARAMRLPGMVRRKVVDGKISEGKEVSLIESSENTYSVEEIDEALNSTWLFDNELTDERWRLWQRYTKEAATGGNRDPLDALLKSDEELFPKPVYAYKNMVADIGGEFPLEICLTKIDRELIANGTGQGDRDNSGYKLACNLVGTAKELNRLGYRFTGNPEQLFDEYCSRCNPPLKSSDRNRIWNQASKADKAFLDEACIENCIKAYKAKHSNDKSAKPIRKKTEGFAKGKTGEKPSTQSNSENTKKRPWYIKPIKELPEIGFHIVGDSDSELVFPELETKRGQEWLQLRKFTPDVVIDSQYFNYDFKPGENLAINSGLGTGKSYYINKKWLADPADGAVLGSYRNCLIEQFCENGEKLNGIPWHKIQQDLVQRNPETGKKEPSKDLALLANPQSRTAGALDSWHYYSPHHFDGKKVISDEVESVMKHLHEGSTAISQWRGKVKRRVADALTNSQANLVADANLRDFTVAYLEEIGGKKFTKIKNDYKGNRGKINYYAGSSRRVKATEEDVKVGRAEKVGEWIVSKRDPNDYSKLHRIMMDLPIQTPILIFSDNQGKCADWDTMLTKRGRRVFRLDSTTSGSDLGKEFLKNPKKFILEHKIDVVILSPSAESGVSIEMEDELKRAIPGYFKYSFIYLFGVVITDTQVQSTGRNRDPYTITFLWQSSDSLPLPRKFEDDQTSDDIRALWNAENMKCASASLVGIEEEEEARRRVIEKLTKKLSDPHTRYEGKLLLKESFERDYPRKCLLYALKEAGCEVTVIESREDSLDDLKEEEEIREQREAELTFNATPVTKEEADSLAKKLDKSENERRQIDRSRLLTKLPDIDTQRVEEKKKIKSSEELEALENALDTKIQTIDGVPYDEWKKDTQEIPEKGVVAEIEKPAFDVEFVKKVKGDEKYIPRFEKQFFLRNLELIKKIQQKKWYKNFMWELSSPEIEDDIPYSKSPSKNLQVNTLYEMGIGFFLNPENTWTKDSPELIEFWEAGKSKEVERHIGVKHEEDACKYLGEVLTKYALNTKKRQKKHPDGSRYREYSIKYPQEKSQNAVVYECVSKRLTEQIANFEPEWKNLFNPPRIEQVTSYSVPLSKEEEIEAAIDIGETAEVLRLDWNVGTTKKEPEVIWMQGFILRERPSQFRDGYIFEAPSGERVMVPDGGFRMDETKQKAKRNALTIIKRLEAPTPQIESEGEMISLYSECEKSFESDLISLELLSKVIAALGKATKWIEETPNAEAILATF